VGIAHWAGMPLTRAHVGRPRWVTNALARRARRLPSCACCSVRRCGGAGEGSVRQRGGPPVDTRVPPAPACSAAPPRSALCSWLPPRVAQRALEGFSSRGGLWIDVTSVTRELSHRVATRRSCRKQPQVCSHRHMRATMGERRHDDRYEIHSAAQSPDTSILYSRNCTPGASRASRQAPRAAWGTQTAPCGRRRARAMQTAET
jgi:hypothetical protein